MKAKDLREMSDEQLGFNLKEARDQLFKLRFQATTERLDAPSSVIKARRDIARINTILRERELQREAQES